MIGLRWPNEPSGENPMAMHTIELGPETLRGYFSRDVTPAVTIDSGDSVRCQTLDAGWGALRQADPFAPPVAFEPRDTTRDYAHALTGPIAVRGARPGMTLEIRFRTIRLSNWGWSAGPALPSQIDAAAGAWRRCGRTSRRDHCPDRRPGDAVGPRRRQATGSHAVGSVDRDAALPGRGRHAGRRAGRSNNFSAALLRRQPRLQRVGRRDAACFCRSRSRGDCCRSATATRSKGTAKSPAPRWPARWSESRSRSISIATCT